MANIVKYSMCSQVILLGLISIVGCKSIVTKRIEGPKNFNYHYEKSGEMLKTAASSVPYSNQYLVEEEEAYPAESANFGTYEIGNSGGQFIGSGYQGGLQGGIQGGLQSGHGLGGINQFGGSGFSGPSSGFGFGGGFNGHQSGGGYSSGLGSNYLSPRLFSGGQIGGYVQRPIASGGIGLHGGQTGGGYIDKSQFESAKKNVGDENLEKVEAKAGNSANQGAQGFNQGTAAQSSAKGDSGYYKDEQANKNLAGDGKSYQGETNFDKAGNNGESENAQKSHKKGHVTKGFKSSHRKDEEEKTETFYDEAHDEADRKNFGQNQGSFGEKSEASFKGGHENESKDAKATGKEGHYNSQNKVDDSKANKGEFGQSAYKGSTEQLHKSNNLGAQSILGQQESSGEYLQKKPYGVLPIHSDK